MAIHPALVVGGGAVATALGVGYGITKFLDKRSQEAEPPKAHVDRLSQAITIGGAIGSAALAIGGGFAMARGGSALSQGLGAAAMVLGAGGALGSIGSGIIYNVRHGSAVETAVSSTLSKYDHNRNGQLDLDARGIFHPTEDIRIDRDCTTDSDGDTDCDTDVFSISRLIARANVDRDRVVTADEISDVYTSFDTDGDGRIQGEEARALDSAVGEDRIYNSWYY